jgi:hypothetical protein
MKGTHKQGHYPCLRVTSTFFLLFMYFFLTDDVVWTTKRLKKHIRSGAVSFILVFMNNDTFYSSSSTRNSGRQSFIFNQNSITIKNNNMFIYTVRFITALLFKVTWPGLHLILLLHSRFPYERAANGVCVLCPPTFIIPLFMFFGDPSLVLNFFSIIEWVVLIFLYFFNSQTKLMTNKVFLWRRGKLKILFPLNHLFILSLISLTYLTTRKIVLEFSE